MAKTDQPSKPSGTLAGPVGSNLPEGREGLLSAFERIVQSLQSKLDLNLILDTLCEEVIRIGLFTSLSIALVDDDRREVVVRRRISRYSHRGKPDNREPLVYPLDDPNITPSVARTGEAATIDG
jgi:hypothetical protein